MCSGVGLIDLLGAVKRWMLSFAEPVVPFGTAVGAIVKVSEVSYSFVAFSRMEERSCIVSFVRFKCKQERSQIRQKCSFVGE